MYSYTHAHGITPDDVKVFTYETDLDEERVAIELGGAQLRLHGDRAGLTKVLVKVLKLVNGIEVDARGVIMGPDNTVTRVPVDELARLAMTFDTTLPNEVEFTVERVHPHPGGGNVVQGHIPSETTHTVISEPAEVVLPDPDSEDG